MSTHEEREEKIRQIFPYVHPEDIEFREKGLSITLRLNYEGQLDPTIWKQAEHLARLFHAKKIRMWVKPRLVLGRQPKIDDELILGYATVIGLSLKITVSDFDADAIGDAT